MMISYQKQVLFPKVKNISDKRSKIVNKKSDSDDNKFKKKSVAKVPRKSR